MRGYFIGRAAGYLAFFGMLALLSGCAGAPIATPGAVAQSPQATADAQLATVCQQIATAYNTASISLANDELTKAEIQTLVSLEPAAEMLCNSSTPPADPQTALTSAQALLNQVSLAVAGVKK